MRRALLALWALFALPVAAQSIECDVSRSAFDTSVAAAWELHSGRIGKVAAAAAQLVEQRDQVIAGLTTERDDARKARDAAIAERNAAIAERDAVTAERDGLLTERAQLQAQLVAAQQALADCKNATPPPPPPPPVTTWCDQMRASLGAANVLRCDDFANAQQAETRVNGGNLLDTSMTATADGTGSIGWRIKSFDQVRTERPDLSAGAAWERARDSHTGNWQRWFGRPVKPGETVYVQFRYRFNAAFKARWGGGGPKVFGLDAGCRVVNGTMIPQDCERFLGTAGSMEVTMTTANWPTQLGAAEPIPVLYQGSANFSGTQGFTPLVQSSRFGTAQLEQNGPAAWRWDGTKIVESCNSLDRLDDPVGVATRCTTYGAPDVWHTITVELRPSGNYFDTNPGATTNRTYRHDTLLRLWYDDALVWDFDPDAAPFRAGALSTQACKDLQQLHPAAEQCMTGVDLFRDSRDRPPGGAWCVAPCEAGDPGADLSQLILWTFSYRRGYPSQAWCDSVVGASDPAYGRCSALATSADAAADFAAFLSHAEVRVNMDDVIVSLVPPRTLQRPTYQVATGPTPPPPLPDPPQGIPAPFQLDAKDIGQAPVNRFVRLWPGPDRTFYNTGYGTRPDGSLAQQRETHTQRQECTNLMREYPVASGVPLGGGFHMPTYGNGRLVYFGGGHSGYMANRVNVFDVASGRWSQSQYTPDMGCWIGGAVGPRVPTPPGTGCPLDGVTLCSAPNGSAGGRGWWEHTDNRIAFDRKLGGWLMVQNSGTWLYNDVTEAWIQLAGPWPEGNSMVCGPGDYTSMGVVWSETHQAAFMWCSVDRVYRWDYAKSNWQHIHTLASANQNPQTDVLSQMVEGPGGRLFMFRGQTTSLYTASETRPWIQWYDPATNTSGRLSTTQPNFPNGLQAPRNIDTFAWVDTNHPCLVGACQSAWPSMAYDPIDNALIVAGQRTGDGRLILWRGRNVLTPQETWSIIDQELVDAPLLAGKHFRLGVLAYLPERDAFLLTLRIGSGNGGASTRNAAECADAPGVAGDCFKMYGFRLAR